MRKLLFTIAWLCALAVPAFGQGQRFGDSPLVVTSPVAGGQLFAVANAHINFCNSPANAVPCTNKATTFTDITLGTPCPTSTQVVLAGTTNCVGTADGFGNWGVWVAVGIYTYTIQLPNGASVGPYTVTVTSGGATNILPLNNVFTGTNNFTGGLTIDGLTVPSLSGTFIAGDCINVQTVVPVITLGDFGSACGGGGGGGSGTVLASPQYQIGAFPNSGSSATIQGVAGLSTDATGNNLIVTGNGVFGGPNPYIDITAPPYNARAVVSVPQTTCTINATSATCLLASASTFQNGDGVVIYGAGTTNAMGAPGSPTVTPSLAIGPLQTGKTVAAPAGSTTYSYTVAGIGSDGSVSVQSSAGVTTTGAAALGALGPVIIVSNWSRSGTTVTVTTSGSHNLPISCTLANCPVIYATGSTDAEFSGFYKVLSVADSTHFTYTQGLDSRGAVISNSATGGTIRVYQSNHLSFAGASGAYQHVICKSGTPVGLTAPGETFWDDYGAAAPAMPSYVTCSNSATNGYLPTKIVSGAGTTSITLVSAAINSVTNAIIKFDDGPAISAALSANLGTVHIPASASNASYPINSHIVSPGFVFIWQAGRLTLNEPLQFNNGGVEWGGDIGGSGCQQPQFGWVCGMLVTVGTSYPGVAFSESIGGNKVTGLTFQAANQSLVMTLGGFSNVIAYDNFQIGSGNADYAGQAIRGYGVVQSTFDHDLFSISNSSAVSLVPSVYLGTDITGSNTSSGDTFESPFFIGRAVGVESIQAVGGNGGFSIRHAYGQGIRTPFITFGNVNAPALYVENLTNDTSTMPTVAILGSTNATVTLNHIANNASEVGGPTGIVSGNVIPGLNLIAVSPIVGQNRETVAIGSTAPPSLDLPIFGFGLAGDHVLTSQTHFPDGHELFFDLAAPSGVSASPIAGGSLGINTFTYQVSSIGINGAPSKPSAASSCTTSGSNLTCAVTWTAVSGATAYNVYRNGNTKAGSLVATNSFNDTGAGCCTNNVPTGTSTGISGINPSGPYGQTLKLWAATSGGISPVATVSSLATASRTHQFPDATGQVCVTGLVGCDYFIDSGAANAYVIAPSPAISSLIDGQTFRIKPANANTTASTLKVGSASAFTIKKSGISTDLIANDIVPNYVFEVTWDGTDSVFLLTSASANGGSGGGGSVGNCSNANSLTYYATSGTTVTCAAIGQLSQYYYAADSGAANAYVVNPLPVIPSLAAGVQAHFTTTSANTGASTINVNSSGVKALTKFGATALVSGDILANAYYVVEYDGTEWQLLNPSAPCLNCVVKNAVNTFTSGGSIDLSASTVSNGFRIPVVSGGTSSLNGAEVYNSTDANVHVGANGVDNLAGLVPASVTLLNADCTQWAVSGSTKTLNSAGLGGCTLLNGNNITGASFRLNMAAATNANAFIFPVQAGAAPTNAGAAGYDSTAQQAVISDGNVVCPLDKQQINAQSGAGYTVLNADCGKLVSLSNAGPQTILMPATPPSKGWYVDLENTGAGTWTVSPNGHNLDNVAGSITIATNQGVRIATDGTSYFTQRGIGGGSGGSGTINAAAQFSLPYYSAVGTTTTLSGVSAPAGPNGVPQYFLEIPSGGAPTTPTAAPAGVVPRTVSGTSDTILATDRAGNDIYTSNSAVAVTLPQAGSTGFASNYVVLLTYTGTNILTITPTTSTINGVATLTMGVNDYCFLYSDNTNYFANCSHGESTQPVVADSGSANAYVVAYPSVQALVKGATVYFTVGNANTTASTLAVNGLTTKNLTKAGAASLIANDLVTTKIYRATYDGTEWQLFNPSNGDLTTFAAHKFLGNNTVSTAQPIASAIGSSDTSPNWYAADTGTANTYLVAPTPALTALTVGSSIFFTAGNANSGASTINVSSLGVKALDKLGASALISGDILVSPAVYQAVYDGTEWIVLNPSTGSGSGTVSNCSVAKSAGFYSSTGTTLTCTSESALTQYLYAADSGAANAYVITLAPALGSLVTGEQAWFTTSNANTTASTINVNGLGVKNITKNGTTALVSGDILASTLYEIVWDGTEWQIINPSSVSALVAANVVTQAANGAAGNILIDTASSKVATALSLSYVSQTDAATVTWAIGSAPIANASLTFTAHSGSRTLNITNPVNGGSYVIWLKQDGTGGEGLTLGTGCTWKVSGGGSGAITPSTGANAVDVLAFTYDGTNCYANFNKNFN